jgi:predicted RNase H-like HicB family nuclease
VKRIRYLVVVEKRSKFLWAYVPDLPGRVAAGESREEVLSLIREAMALHLEGLKEQGQPIPAPASSTSDHVEVEAA